MFLEHFARLGIFQKILKLVGERETGRGESEDSVDDASSASGDKPGE